MGAIPYAFSVHHFISTVGADAGFAAIIGLAVLILLYFSQARETASLRDWADESDEHVRQLESRIAQLTRAQSAAPSSYPSTAPAPPPPGIIRSGATPAAATARTGAASPVVSRAAAPGPVPVAATAPAAPAGVGAPALSAATRLIPSSDREQILIRARTATDVADEERSGLSAGDTAIASGPPPATAAGGANGSPPSRMAPSSPASLPTQPPSRAGARRGELPGSARSGGGVPRRPVAPASRTGSPAGRRRPFGRGVIVALGLLGVIAVVVVALVLTSGGSSPKSPTTSSASGATNANGSHRRTVRAVTAVTPATVTVAVLNGTSTTNLAHSVAARLTAAGFKEGTVATASDQTQTTTVVGYMPHHRSAALIVARSLKLGSASVQPVDQSNQTVACPASSTPCSAQVVVTVGADLASNA